MNKIYFTNLCKDKILHAKNGIKFALKGYAFYSATLPTDEDELKNLTLTDLDSSKIIINEYKDKTEFRDRLFDMTYIPSLENSVINTIETDDGSAGREELVNKFGTYEIAVNKGLFKTLPIDISYILLIGEELDETNEYMKLMKKNYLAAIIPYEKEITEDETFNPYKIALQVSFTDFTEAPENANILVDELVDDVTENESFKNLNVIQLSGSLTLTPDTRNNDYSSEFSFITDGNADTKYFPGNITLFDETEKVNNGWNTNTRVLVGIDENENVSLPHTQLMYADTEGETLDINSVSIQHHADKGYFAVNQDDGIDNLQANIFPEDVDRENKKCLKTRIKKSNSTFNYDDISASKSHFRFDSCNSKYGAGASHIFESENNGTTISSNLPSEYISIIDSDNNKINGENEEILIMNSDSNVIGNGINDLTLINTFSSNIINVPRKYEEGDTVGQTEVYLNNNVLIGVEGLDSRIEVPFTGNNITFIGSNTSSTYAPSITDSMYELDSVRTIRGIFTRTFNEDSDSDTVIDIVNSDLMVSAYSAQLIENQALIGFGGLTVNKIPNREYFYPEKQQIGNARDGMDFYYYGEPTANINRNYSIVFGSYNANDNLNGLSAVKDLSINSLFKLKGKISTFEEPVFSSYYDSNFTYSTDENTPASAQVKLHKLFFNHTQDSLFASEEYSAAWSNITADEGDFGINKILVVGNGYNYINGNVTGHSPAEFASKNTDYSDVCKRINLFSIEKDSIQLVHNNAFDDNPHYSATNVMNLPGMFAVRGIKPITQKYTYHFITKTDENNNKFIDKEMYENINKYNIQNSVYTPSGIYIPLQRSSNDLYKMNFGNIKGLLSNDVLQKTKTLSYDTLRDLSNKIQYTYILPTKGLKSRKIVNGTQVNEILYDFNINQLVDWYNTNKNTNIPKLNRNSTDTNIYTFYIINDNYEHSLNFQGIRINYQDYTNLYRTREIPIGKCIKVDYKGRHGVVNFNYWNAGNNSFYK